MQILITGATVFTGAGAVLQPGAVLLTDSRIVAVEGEITAPPGATVVDARGRFLMAGLIDAHSHLALPDVPERPEPHPDTPFLAARAARAKLSAGVTTVRDVGGNNHVDLALKRAIDRGDVIGPRMLVAGKPIAATGGHIWYWAREADGPDEVRRAVREQIKAGADLIKLMLSGGAANVGERPDRMQLKEDEIRVAVAEATEAGRRVAAHALPSRAIQIAADAGIASIEHGAFLDEPAIEALVRNGTYLVPTQAVYQRIADNVDGWSEDKARAAQAIVERKMPALRKAIEAGVKIGIGTDSGRHFPSNEIASELAVLGQVGLAPEAALLAATRGNAELLGIENEIGTIEVGKRADLVLLHADPRADIGQVRNVELIVRDGRIFNPRELEFQSEKT
ncbi:MAG TPA: amidohydrolase family protein [Chloroflexota bacterium]